MDNTLESSITNPTQAIKVQTLTDINHFGFANRNVSVLTQLTPPSSPPQSAESSPLPVLPALETVTANLPIGVSNNDGQEENSY